MIDQVKIIKSSHWDHLIVLDACRYDYFVNLWKFKQYNVLKALSPASWTLEWLSIMFDKPFPNTIVYSANPYINNLKIPICVHGICWNAHNKFKRIIEVWKLAWSKRLMSVPPWKLYNIVKMNLEIEKRMGTRSRTITWFLQPHYPYLSKEFIKLLHLVDGLNESDFLRGSFDIVIRNILREIIKRNYIILRNIYEENLKIALYYVYKLVEKLNGTIIVTSDHGEHLGENILKVVLTSIMNHIISITFGSYRRTLYLQTKLKQLKSIIHSYISRRTHVNNSYYYKGRVFFHPPLVSGHELRHVPLVIIHK